MLTLKHLQQDGGLVGAGSRERKSDKMVGRNWRRQAMVPWYRLQQRRKAQRAPPFTSVFRSPAEETLETSTVRLPQRRGREKLFTLFGRVPHCPLYSGVFQEPGITK